MLSSSFKNSQPMNLKPLQTQGKVHPSSPSHGNSPTHGVSKGCETNVDSRVRGNRAAFDACQASVTDSGLDTATSITGDVNSTERGQLGYKINFNELYDVQKEIGRGAFGVVTRVLHKASNRRFACKSIPKVLPGMEKQKEKGHLESIQREVFVLNELKSCLNVAKLEDVFESDTHVHIVQELCEGGELEHSIGKSHYSERTVASYMRAVLKTLAQCHVHNILHRDIKPGNFMLACKHEDARLKAIDFGLAVPFNEHSDLTDLTMQGTPWFLAPETLSSKWSTKSDVWAAGVMTHQLLTGRLPFNDKRNPFNPALSAVLRSVLTDKLDFQKSYWSDISKEGKDFIKFMLNRDPNARPTAQEALQHPWLQGDISDRHKGTPLSFQVVQRVQRYGRNNILKRSLLSLMVSELIEDEAGTSARACSVDDKGRPLMDSPNAHAITSVLKYLNLKGKTEVTHSDLAKGLRKMGYRLSDDEIQRLMDAIGGGSDSVNRSTIIASQIDWSYLQRFQKQRWLELTRRAFDNIDVDADGKVTVEELMRALEDRIPADELNDLFEATTAVASVPRGVDVPLPGQSSDVSIGAIRPLSFQTFMSLLRQPSEDSLDHYDDRLEGSFRSNRTDSTTWTRSSGQAASHAGIGSHSHAGHSRRSSGYLEAVYPHSSNPPSSGCLLSPHAYNGSTAPSPPESGTGVLKDVRLDPAVRMAQEGVSSHSHHGRDLQTVFERVSVTSTKERR